jgi:hypothetical protein
MKIRVPGQLCIVQLYSGLLEAKGRAFLGSLQSKPPCLSIAPFGDFFWSESSPGGIPKVLSFLLKSTETADIFDNS